MEKPIIVVDLKGAEGNIFALMATARIAIISAARRPGFRIGKLVEESERDQRNAEFVSRQMMNEVMLAHSYDEALGIVRRYVTIREEV